DEFTTTLTLCFTPEHLGEAPHYTSPAKRPADFADFARWAVERYAPAAVLDISQRKTLQGTVMY
ncbi:MAG: beta-xylosidase, partial [Acidobacteria bacterium]